MTSSSLSSSSFIRCTVCHVTLPENYYEDDGKPYCKEDFFMKLSHKCHQCTDYITGPTMVTVLYVYVFKCGCNDN